GQTGHGGGITVNKPDTLSPCSRFSVAAFILGFIMTCSQTQALGADSEQQRLLEIKKLLREVPLIDGHNDLPWQYRKHSNDFGTINLTGDTRPLKMATDIPRLRAGCLGGQFWSVYVPATLPGPEAIKAVLEQIDVVYRLAAKYPDTFEIALSASDIE